MGFKKRGLFIFLSIILLTETSAQAGVFKSCYERLMHGKVSKTTAAVVLSGAVALGALPGYFHDANAAVRGKEHVGYAIYLDMDEVRASLTADERALLDNPQKNKDEIVKMLIQKLRGGFSDENLGSENIFNSDFWAHREACEFLNEGVPHRGVCRHKSVILAGILNQLGIPARTRLAEPTDQSTEWHMYVEVIDEKKIADPTWGCYISKDIYEQKLASCNMRESERQYENDSLFDHIQLGLVR